VRQNTPLNEHAPAIVAPVERELAVPARSLGGGPFFTTPARLRELQRTAGNAAVNRVLARRELESGRRPNRTADWSEDDRTGGTTRWQSANLANLLAGDSSQYVTPAQRSSFYRWFYIFTTTHPDPAHRSECRWPLAASVVAAGVWDMVNLPNSEGLAKTAGVSSEEVQTILRRGNQIIMDDVFAKLRDLYLNPRVGQAALDWDAQTLSEEQNLMQPLYDGASTEANSILQNMATGTWRSARVGAAVASSATVAPGPNIRGGTVPWFSGTMRDMATRWRYGNLIANTFSTITPSGTVATGPPTVSAAYSSGSLFGALDWRRHLHAFEAATDNAIWTTGEEQAAIDAMRSFTVREQHHFLGNWDFYRTRILTTLFGAPDTLQGMTPWSANLPVQIRFLDALDMSWQSSVDYGSGTSDLRPMVRNASPAGRAAVRGSFFQDIFVKVCTDSTIIDAVNDLGIADPERQRWIDDERSW
jgi:hypothetical protein